jgi:hypothetical protein
MRGMVLGDRFGGDEEGNEEKDWEEYGRNIDLKKRGRV